MDLQLIIRVRAAPAQPPGRRDRLALAATISAVAVDGGAVSQTRVRAAPGRLSIAVHARRLGHVQPYRGGLSQLPGALADELRSWATEALPLIGPRLAREGMHLDRYRSNALVAEVSGPVIAVARGAEG